MSNGGTEKNKVIAGVIIGMMLGIVAACAVAWYVFNKNPAEFISRDKSRSATPVAKATTNPPAVETASGVAPAKQHFEFYKILTEKPDAQARMTPAKPNAQAAPPETKDLYFVQAGSFQNADDAEKLKAKLAFSGFEASIQTANIPDKGIWHRVRLGPYNNTEAGKTIVALRQTGIIATQVRAQ